MSKKIKWLVQAGLIAGIYVMLTLLQETVLPGSGSMAIQFRLAEALTVLAFFTPSAIAGLSVGCLLSNLLTLGVLPLDLLVGTAATAAAAVGMYLTRNIRVGKLPLLGMTFPVICNGLLVGWELTAAMGGGFLLNCGTVALGELAVVAVCGTALFLTLQSRGIRKYLV